MGEKSPGSRTNRTGSGRIGEAMAERTINIKDYLGHGIENAITARQLQYITPWKGARQVTHQIEIERRAGAPICASCEGEYRGYYLAETKDDLLRYCEALERREIEIAKTRKALVDISTVKAPGEV